MPKLFCFDSLEPRRLLSSAVFVPPADPRLSVDLDPGWRFVRSNPSGASGKSFNDSSWSKVSLPHTWNNLDGQDGGNNYYRGTGWYRKHITPSSSMKNKRIVVRFDGANMNTDLYVNGTLVGSHKGGYAGFDFDVTSYLTIGSDNVLAVKVNNSSSIDQAPLSGDWSLDGGLYRDVKLIATNKAHIDLLDAGSPGVYIKQSNVSTSSATLSIKTKLRSDYSTTTSNLSIETNIVDAAGNVVKKTTSSKTLTPKTSYSLMQTITLTNPHLWNGLKDPYMYTVYVTVKSGTSVVDTMSQPLGLRYFKVDPNLGFFLNGQPYDLHGVSMHQDRIDKGYAVSDADRTEDVNLIKEIGATFVRLSTYEFEQTTYDLLDRAGIVVTTEIPVVNYANSSTSFVDNAKQQLKELIRQNYNHPSIVFWGLFNEIPDNSNSWSLIPQLNSLAHSEDSTRLTTGASFNKISDSSALNTSTDVIGVNQYYGWYAGVPDELATWADNVHAAYPTRKIGLSEYGAGASIYQHELHPANIITTGTWHPEEYQSLVHEQTWAILKDRSYLWQKTIWNMFDFASDLRSEGDQMGRNDKGLVTYDRKVKKDVFYFYKANWSDEKFAYITSRRWTDRTDALTDVKVYSNFDNVELLINGQPMGALSAPDHIFVWHDVTLAEGENTIQAIPISEGSTVEDDVVWTLTSPQAPPPEMDSALRLPMPSFPLQFPPHSNLKDVLDGQSEEV